jgi:hypothetical protein
MRKILEASFWGFVKKVRTLFPNNQRKIASKGQIPRKVWLKFSIN